MMLKVLNKENRNLDEFMEYMTQVCAKVILDSIDKQKLKARDEKVNDVATLLTTKKITAYQVVNTAVALLYWKRSFDNSYTITINENRPLYGTANKVYDLTKLIEYGVIGLPPLRLFNNAFDKIGEKITEYYVFWEETKGERRA